MKFEYAFLSFPQEPSGYRAVTQTDGILLLFIDGAEFLQLEDILILEFACYVNSWLENALANDTRSFYFRSIDEEEEPLLAFDRTKNGSFRARSCWSDATSRELSSSEVEDCFFDFLASLRNRLQNDFHYNFDDALRSFRVG